MDLGTFTFDSVQWGTVAAWVTGILTVVFAGLAWQQARNATRWARIAAQAQDRANALTERLYSPRFNMHFERYLDIGWEDPPGDMKTRIVLMLDTNSSPVWIHEVTLTSGFFLNDDDEIISQDLDSHHLLERFFRLPIELRHDRALNLMDPYSVEHGSGFIGLQVAVSADVTYSMTKDGERHVVTGIRVDGSQLELDGND